jgi:hypothetical protein
MGAAPHPSAPQLRLPASAIAGFHRAGKIQQGTDAPFPGLVGGLDLGPDVRPIWTLAQVACQLNELAQ